MNEKLPQKYTNNFFIRFISKFKYLFCDKGKIDIINQPINASKSKEKIHSKLIFSEQIKVVINSQNEEYEKKQFMENLTNNPNLLQDFSNERLEKILQYYLEENENKRKTLRKLIV